MILKVVSTPPEHDVGGHSEETFPGTDDQDLPVVERLKEQFGDYSDPQAYDWSWRETD